MKVLLTGGGTGGHITPILAVAHKLKEKRPDVTVVYVGNRGSKFADLTTGSSHIDTAYSIFSGKFRRYHGESWLQRLLDAKTNLLNLRDAFFVVIGLLQSAWLIARERPDVILLKGGFVGVPIGLAATLFRVPFITHDSDTQPGLANRLVSRWASYHATGMAPENYAYPKDSIRYVGVLVSDDYQPVSADQQAAYKKDLDIPADAKLLLITGGSLGAQRLNKAMRHFVPQLLDQHDDLYIIHQVGRGNMSIYNDFSHERLTPLEFMQGMHRYTGAADVVVTRAGANTLAELGVQGKACIVVPNPLLTDGHQLKNAAYLQHEEAAIIVEETEMTGEAPILINHIQELLRDGRQRKQLGKKMQSLTKPDAAEALAVLLLDTAKH